MKSPAKPKRRNNLPVPVVIISGKSPYTATGGYASYARNIAKIITATGHPVHLLTFADKQKIEKRDIAIVHFVKARWLNHLPIIRNIELAALPFYSILFFRELTAILKKYRYKRIVVWGIGPWGLAGALVKIFMGAKVILITSHFTTFRHEMKGSLQAARIIDYGFSTKLKYLFVYHVIARLYSLLSRFVVRNSEKIITHYRSSEKILTSEFGVPAENFFRISYFVELFKKEIKKPIPKRMQKILHSSKPLVTCICRQDPRKGINYLLHAMTIVKKQVDCECAIIGAGILRDANIHLARKLKLNSIVFPGALADIRTVLQKSAVYVLPTVEEGSGALSVIEAMSEGLPIVTTTCDGIPEDIQDNYSGILVPPHDSVLLAKAIVRTLTDGSLARKLGTNAKKTYEKKFTFSGMKKDIQRLLKTL